MIINKNQLIQQFEENILKSRLFTKDEFILLAFSGGVDSVVLADLLLKNGYKFSIAHCNFMLRSSESDEDTKFSQQYAQENKIPFFVSYFNTKEYARDHKQSIQMAARTLRYNWFNQLIEEHCFKKILTAHHANDNAETMFVNLVRGTGIKGLSGIPEIQHEIVRPLLFATKESIEEYAKTNGLNYREDSSNREVKYKRNFIRHQIIPELKKLNPNIEQTITNSIQFFKQSAEIVCAYADQKFKQICNEKDGRLTISIELLKNEPYKETLLFEWLYNMQFKTQQIKQLIDVISGSDFVGKQFSSATHQLIVDRKYILVERKKYNDEVITYNIESLTDTIHLPIELHFELSSNVLLTKDKNRVTIAYDEGMFPLTLRKWKHGDKFIPLGMKGFKKLSDFFKDQKFSFFDKNAVWILENSSHIIWIVGHRIDDRCKVNDKTERMISIQVN